MIIESGSIIRRTAGSTPEEVSYDLRFVDQSFLDQIMELQEVISLSLTDEEMFRLDSKDYFGNHFCREKAVMAAFAKDEMIAYHVISFPGKDEDNFGADIGIPKMELKKVAHLETMAVHPKYRGNSLQRRMIGHHLKVIESLGFDHVCCTVSPKNHASMLNLFANSLKIKGLKTKFSWRIRYIMHRSLLHSETFGPDAQELEAVDGSDLAAQSDLLKRGFTGFRAEKQGEIMKVFYSIPGTRSSSAL